MAFMRRSRRRNETAAWAVAAGAAVGAGGAILYLLEPARRTRAAEAARRAGQRAADAARRSRESAGTAVRSGAARARELAAGARRAGEEAGARAQALAGDLRARAGEVKGQLEELERRGEGRGDNPGAAAAILLGRALLGKGLLRVPFGLAGLSLAGRTSPARRGATAAARMARGAAGALRTQRERLQHAAAAAGDADHPSVAGVGEVRDPLEASGREPPLPEAPRSDAPEEEGGPGLRAAGGEDDVERGPEAESAPLVTAPDAAVPDADEAPRIEAPGERHVDRAGRPRGGAGPSYDLK